MEEEEDLEDVADEKVASNGSETLYTAKIPSFLHKIRTWSPGQMIPLSSFEHNGVVLSLEVYPKGHLPKDDGHVSIFLSNDNDFDIEVEGHVQVGPIQLNWDRALIPRNAVAGNGRLFTVKREEEMTEFEFRFRTDFREVTDKDMDINLTISKVWKGIKTNARALDQPSGANNRLETEIQSLRQEMNDLTTALSSSSINSNNSNVRLPKPECPVCFEEMKPGTKIAQCLSGHLICWSCKDIISFHGVEQCPSCKLPVNGRAYGMENYIKTLFS